MTDVVDKRWGNPAHVTFAKNHVRLAAVDDLRVKVHRVLVPIVERLLTDLSVRDLRVEELEGYPAVERADGIRLRLTSVAPGIVAGVLVKYGFAVTDVESQYRWIGSFDDAMTVGAALDAAADAELAGIVPTSSGAEPGGRPAPSSPSDSPERAEAAPTAAPSSKVERVAVPTDEDWNNTLPGLVDVGPGSVGRAVLFLQAYFGTDRSGVYDKKLAAAVRDYQVVRGVEPTGLVNNGTWRHIVPMIRPRLDAGDAGRGVRIFSAALVASGEIDRGSVVHLRYGIALSRTVREFQSRHGIRPSGRTGGIEWGMLVGSPFVVGE